MHLELLRFATIGSVDDGKSTLIGRLLHDSKAVFEDQLSSLRAACGGTIDLAFITDGLRAEREQGITIDVAYRYFSTPLRKFILADCPGHEQYTRNMASGVSSAQLAVILIDSGRGVLPQTRRHAFIAWLFGIRNLVFAINKMDLAGYREDIFAKLCEDCSKLMEKLPGCNLRFIPVSALKGDNIVSRSPNMPWHTDGTLLEYLENVPLRAGGSVHEAPLRFPVQYVIRGENGFRGYAGQIASGAMGERDEVLILPSARTTRVLSISTCRGDLPSAIAPMPATLRLENDVDVSRGNMLVDPANPPTISRQLCAKLVWLSETPLSLNRRYLLKHTTQQVYAEVVRLTSRVNFETLKTEDADRLCENQIGTVELETHQPLFYDLYEQNRVTGSLILIDPISNETLAAGTICVSPERPQQQPKRAATGQRGLTVWFTGLSSAGKTTLSQGLYERLRARGYRVELLDGDIVRQHLSRDLGFTKQDRDENIRRIGYVAKLLTRNGVIVLVSAISPYRAAREEVRSGIGDFVEVYVNAPLKICEQRDVKGLYRKARAGQIRGFTGVNDPYEPPLEPEIECRTDRETVAAGVDRILTFLEDSGYIG